MKGLFADMLKPKLHKPKATGGTYWTMLQGWVRDYNECGKSWVTASTGYIRRKRQLDKHEPVITYYVLAALSSATNGFRVVGPIQQLMTRAFGDPAVADRAMAVLTQWGWDGLQFEAQMTPTQRIRDAVAAQTDGFPVAYVREIAKRKKGVRFESATHLDAYVGNSACLTNGDGTAGLGIEAKFTSDIDGHTTYCAHRNQIIRNVEVGHERHAEFLFLLLTPRAYRERMSRLYCYKMKEYMGPTGVDALRRDALIDPCQGACAWQKRIGWLDWEDMIAVAYPNGQPAFSHPDADALAAVLKERRLWPW